MKEFYNDTYAKTIECTVVNVIATENQTQVFTDCTICYPECGGQPGDKGILGNYPILDTLKADNGDSIHCLPAGCSIKEGEKLTMSLDWNHRYKFMVMHTAQHMLSGLLFNNFNIGTVSVHLGDDYLTIETNTENVDTETIDKLVSATNDKIAESHKVIYHEMSHSDAEALGLRRSIKVSGDVRIVEIQDVDRIACGGIHVASTSEIRLITYIGQQKIRDHARLFFICGKEAQSAVLANINYLDALKEKMSCSSYDELVPKTDKTIETLNELKLKVKNFSDKLARLEIQENLCGNIAVFHTDLDIESFTKTSESFDNLALCVMNKNNWLIIFKGSFADIDFNIIREKILNPCNAKGGGKNGYYRGSSPCDIIALFKQLQLK